jgi:hypothetical protein
MRLRLHLEIITSASDETVGQHDPCYQGSCHLKSLVVKGKGERCESSKPLVAPNLTQELVPVILELHTPA